MDDVIKKLKLDIDMLEQRVEAKEAILKNVFASLEDFSANGRMIREDMDRKEISENLPGLSLLPLKGKRFSWEKFLRQPLIYMHSYFVLSVVPKIPPSPSYASVEQRWCVGFEDTICVSFTVKNASDQYNIEALCHLPEDDGNLVKCVMLDQNGSNTSFIRPGSTADVLVGFPRSTYFSKNSCTLLLEFIHHPLSSRTFNGVSVPVAMLAQPYLPSLEVHTLNVTAPHKWCSLPDFNSAKEQDMLLLLRCLKVGSYVCSIKPTTPFDFIEGNPEFDCCDFGEWQVFVGNKLMSGIVAVSSVLDQPNARIDQIYGTDPQILQKFAEKCNR